MSQALEKGDGSAILTPVSHVNTALSDEAQDFLQGRVEFLEEWGMNEAPAMNQAYAEMLRRYLPEGSPVLRYYPVTPA